VHGTYNKEANEPVISWSEAIVDELGRLRGKAVFEVYVRQKTQRSFWLYGMVDKSGSSTDGQSQRKFENERCTRRETTSRHEISTLAPFLSIARLQAAASIPACRNC